MENGTPVYFPENDDDTLPPSSDFRSVIPWIFKTLQSICPKGVSFEEVWHTLELLQPYILGTTDSSKTSVAPILTAFTKLWEDHDWLKDPLIPMFARGWIIKTIFECISHRCQGKADPEFKNFFKKLREHFQLRVFTLNYDNFIDDVFDDWFDGFQSDGCQYELPNNTNIQTFSARDFNQFYPNHPAVLAHLHGSVRFGFNPEGQGVVAKYASSTEALSSIRHTYTPDKGVNGKIVSAFPLISGMDKEAKLIYNPAPFGYYYKAFMDSLMTTPRLLLIGYGARDEHLNAWLQEFCYLHWPEERRIVFIGKENKNSIRYSPTIRLMKNFVGPFEWRWNYPFDENDPQCQFLRFGSVAASYTGFPLKNSQTLDRIIEFLLAL